MSGEGEALPAPVEMFFSGTPIGTKIDELGALMAAEFQVTFVGPYTGATTGMVLDKEHALGAFKALAASFPDFTFNPKIETPIKNETGGYGALIVVTGKHDGEPFTPMPGVLPPMEAKGTECCIGPEVFTMYVNDEGKATKIEIEPQHEGALAGPPGFYVLVGGTLPSAAAPAGAGAGAAAEATATATAAAEAFPAGPTMMADAEWEGDLQYMSLYLDRKEQVEDENQAYLEAHPAVQQMCSDFLVHLMHRKPEDVVGEAQRFFTKYSQSVAPSKHVFELQ
eukprot:gene4163-19170_t